MVRRGEERDSLTNREKGGKKKKRRKKEERKSLCSGSGSTSFLAPQWETMKY